MKPDDFEQHLQRQPMRQVPSEWREEILSAARQAARPQAAPRAPRHAWRTVFSTLNSHLSTLLWPHPAAWAGLAAVWVAMLGLHLATHDVAPLVAKGSPAPSPQVFMAFQEQQRLLNELIGSRETPPVEPPKPALPRPRSERQSRLLMA